MLMTFNEIITRFNDKKNTFISGLWGASFAFFISRIYSQINHNIIIIFDHIKQAELFQIDLGFFLSQDDIIFYPELDISPYDKIYDKQLIIERIKSYSRTVNKEKYVFITSLKNTLLRFSTEKYFLDHIDHIKIEDTVNLDDFTEKLIISGYERTHKVFQKGTFAIRGDIIDIFPPNYNDPVRIELFDDIVEDIRSFKRDTQKSSDKFKEVYIFPAEEIILDKETKERFCNKIDIVIKDNDKKNPDELWDETLLNKDVLIELKEKVNTNEFFNDIYNYIPVFFQEHESLLKKMQNDNSLLFFPAHDKFLEAYEITDEEMHEFHKKRSIQHYYVPEPDKFIFKLKDIEDIISKQKVVFYNILPFNADDEITFHIKGIPSFAGDMKRFFKYYADRVKKDYKITFLSQYEGSLTTLKDLIKKQNDSDIKINFKKGSISQGFEIDIIDTIFIQDFEFLGRIRKDFTKTSKSKILTQEIESVYDIEEGDYVVHIENGIGIYRGIKRIKTDEKMRDFFIIEYANEMNLFLPLEKINMIHKYIGDENRLPNLNKIGSNEFRKTKAKVEKSIITVTKDLLKLYAIRNKVKGYQFKDDTDWQKKFEMSFKYVETPDQIRTLNEIKDEMESEKPMDRLLCGDVGYGKTEVALRIAFKVVMEGKQVAILVPTTILAQQHYNTFKERLKDFPVRVEMLSRFLNTREQKKVIKDANEGKVDIIIGTHRLLSPQLKFDDIGLIIIDEEQRFGVVHKEKLKMIRHVVDVLTMSATPIPRTLYMSLSGIRDISLIETPPEGRMPIDTKVEKFSKEEIRKAILNEIERGGQIFFVHNRINSIYAMKDFLQRTVPEAKFIAAHGRMESDELEIAMLDFVDKNYDVLISTTIIESGIDMPNVNTIIINRADTFGLSQLYQLRGRVGRGLHKGHALLLYPGNRSITDTAQKRLLTIYEYSDLGAGYKIALRDLEIRGAGNIFGPQQHGNIIAIGLELYSKILKITINKMKGELINDDSEVDLNFEYNAFIPVSYINENKIKIEIYKKLNKCREFGDIVLFREELKDRFGKDITKEMKNLFIIQEIKIICKKINIIAIKRSEINTYEYVFKCVLVEMTKNIKKKLEKIFKTYRIEKNYFYINIEKDNFLIKLKKKLLLLI